MKMKLVLALALTLGAFGCSHRPSFDHPVGGEDLRRPSSEGVQNIVLPEGYWLRAQQLGPNDTVLCGNSGYVTQWGMVDDTDLNVRACGVRYHDKFPSGGGSCIVRRNVGQCQILTYQDFMNLPQITVFKHGRFVEERKAGANLDDVADEVSLTCQ